VSPLVLLTAGDCHLCERAKEVLAELGVEWRELDGETQEGCALAASVPPMRPVLLGADGRVLAYGRLSLRRLRNQLGAEAVRT
jgi:hypothetical protein